MIKHGAFARLPASRRSRVAVVGSVAALALGMVPVIYVSEALAVSKSPVTNVKIKEAELDVSGDVQLQVGVECPKGDNNYLYAEIDQDLFPNDAAGNVYVGSFICTGNSQTLNVTVTHGRGITAMDYDNDVEADDLATFTSGFAAVLVTFGGQSNFTALQRVVSLEHV